MERPPPRNDLDWKSARARDLAAQVIDLWAEWLDKLAGALGAPRSRLYRAAGRIPPSTEDDRADVIEAILTDPDFTQEEKSFLVNAVKFIRQYRGIGRQGSK